MDEERDTIFEDRGADEKRLLAEIDFGLTESGRFLLKVIGGPNNGAEFFMEPGHAYTVGNAPASCDIVFNDASVSRQHARIHIGRDNKAMIEDLKSRNGTMVDGAKISKKIPLAANSVVSVGTTLFIVFDREAERETVITPLLPSIVKSLHKEEEKREVAQKKELPPPTEPKVKAPPPKKEEVAHLFPAIMIVLLLLMAFAIIALGTRSLFRPQIKEEKLPVDYDKEIKNALHDWPAIQYSYNKSAGQVLLTGHVSKEIERSQLLYNLQSLPFIHSVDYENVIVDEFRVKEVNSILAKIPDWRGIVLRAPEPGHFILSGYLKTKKQAEELSDYIAQNFYYLDKLDKQIYIEEDELSAISLLLQESGFRDIGAQMNLGELTLTGNVTQDRLPKLQLLLQRISKDPAVKVIKNFVVTIAPQEEIVDLTSNYRVTGYSNQGGVNTTVVIKGRILSRGDLLDGMVIKEITVNTVFLEKDNIRYKIEYNR